jgi:hypothetical protein
LTTFEKIVWAQILILLNIEDPHLMGLFPGLWLMPSASKLKGQKCKQLFFVGLAFVCALTSVHTIASQLFSKLPNDQSKKATMRGDNPASL